MNFLRFRQVALRAIDVIYEHDGTWRVQQYDEDLTSSHMEGIVEGTLCGRHKVELLEGKEVGDRGDIVREYMLPESHDASQVVSPFRAPLRKLELLHHLSRAKQCHAKSWRKESVLVPGRCFTNLVQVPCCTKSSVRCVRAVLSCISE